jgi:hypothetical protein
MTDRDYGKTLRAAQNSVEFCAARFFPASVQPDHLIVVGSAFASDHGVAQCDCFVVGHQSFTDENKPR